jgi:hypothetical protein
MRTTLTLIVVLCSSSLCGAWSSLRASTLHNSRVQLPSLIATRLLESSLEGTLQTHTVTTKEDSTTPASTDSEKPNDEAHWIRDGLLKAAFSSDLYDDEDQEKDSEVGVIAKATAVVGPFTVLIYDTTLRGTCWKSLRASFLRTY